MITVYIFAISGLSIATLIVAKRLEEKRKKTLFVSRAISKGDIHIRRLYHATVHFYSEGKEKGLFLLKKQIPIHSKNSLNKTISFLKEKRVQYINNMRDSRLLKKSDGISEFFKNMSEVEKGNGTIHDVYEDSSQNIEEKVK
jgi:hypothetical protein